MKNTFYLLCLLICIPFNVGVSYACDCWPVSSANEAMKGATLVFEGQVIQMQRFAIEKLGKDYKEFAVKFRIVKVWKGPVEDYFIVRTPADKEHCGFEFKNGETYIVYAIGGPIPFVTRCSRTTSIESQSASNDIKVLGPPKEK